MRGTATQWSHVGAVLEASRTADSTASVGQLESSGQRALHAFGSGRQQCPGEHFALTTVLLAASKVLWAFELEKPEAGVDISIEMGYKCGSVMEPLEPTVLFRIRDK